MQTQLAPVPERSDTLVVRSAYFLVDFGQATGLTAIDSWMCHFRAALDAVSREEWKGLLIPMEVTARGRSGRTVLRVFAPDPDRAVEVASAAMQDGPSVRPL